jgi:hypothetical protein
MGKGIVKLFAIMLLSTTGLMAQEESPDLTQLLGSWKLDMSPSDTSDDNFAHMEITAIDENTLEGTFYRKGVEIQVGKVNTQSGRVYAALISGDNSGTYHTSFYFEDGLLYGSTHAIDRGFLAVWIATKEKNLEGLNQ